MNCCNDFGVCERGANCPCRKAATKEASKLKAWAYFSTVLATLGVVAVGLALLFYFGRAPK